MSYAIQIDNLKKSYGNHVVLKGLTFGVVVVATCSKYINYGNGQIGFVYFVFCLQSSINSYYSGVQLSFSLKESKLSAWAVHLFRRELAISYLCLPLRYRATS